MIFFLSFITLTFSGFHQSLAQSCSPSRPGETKLVMVDIMEHRVGFEVTFDISSDSTVGVNETAVQICYRAVENIPDVDHSCEYHEKKVASFFSGSDAKRYEVTGYIEGTRETEMAHELKRQLNSNLENIPEAINFSILDDEVKVDEVEVSYTPDQYCR